MIIAGRYSFNMGSEFILKNFPQHLSEIEQCIKSIDKAKHKDKTSKEKPMSGKLLYSPSSLNKEFKKYLGAKDWVSNKLYCEYTKKHYTKEYIRPTDIPQTMGAHREMDFVKDKLGIEVQFGKYSFMVCSVCAKMTIFKNLKIIDAGIAIVPVKELADEMSTGVSYFEQFVWDLENRGVSDIDIPVLILGIA